MTFSVLQNVLIFTISATIYLSIDFQFVTDTMTLVDSVFLSYRLTLEQLGVRWERFVILGGLKCI